MTATRQAARTTPLRKHAAALSVPTPVEVRADLELLRELLASSTGVQSSLTSIAAAALRRGIDGMISEAANVDETPEP
jgi:hypothetical protein